MQGDRIIFGGSMTVFEMGVYSIAVLILGALQTGVLKVVGAVALPAFGEAARTNDFERLRRLYYRFKMMVDVALLFLCGFLWVTSPLIIKVLYDDRYAQAGHMMAVLSTSFFVMRYIVANQIWIALGLTKYQAIDNIIRVVSLWVLVPLLLAFGGVDWAIWGVALHTLPTLVLVVYVNRRVGILDIKRELIVLPMLVVGALGGELVLVVFKWLFDLSA